MAWQGKGRDTIFWNGTIEANQVISNSAPITDLDLANKAYVDSVAGGMSSHAINGAYHTSGGLLAGYVIISSGASIQNGTNTDSQIASTVTNSHSHANSSILANTTESFLALQKTNYDLASQARHTQNTDTDLTSGAILTGYLTASDHGSASSAMIVNVCYGTGTAPTASTTPEGTLYVKYTA